MWLRFAETTALKKTTPLALFFTYLKKGGKIITATDTSKLS